MPLEKSASYWADLVHADHPHKPLPANTGQQKGTLTKRQRGSRLDAKNTPQGVIIASEFTPQSSSDRQPPRPVPRPELPARHAADRLDRRAVTCNERIVLARVGASLKIGAARGFAPVTVWSTSRPRLGER